MQSPVLDDDKSRAGTFRTDTFRTNTFRSDTFPNPASGAASDDGESFEIRLERLGRQRPERFKSIWAEMGFVYAIVMSQVLTVGDLEILASTWILA